MFDFLKSHKAPETTTEAETTNWASRLKAGLARTRQQLTGGLSNLLLGKKTIDAELLEELETQLIRADVGVATTQQLLDTLKDKTERKELSNPEALFQSLKQLMQDLLTPYSQALELKAKPSVILMVGVNGAGKTTSIAKIAHYYQEQGQKVMLAAGDTFRAAAVEQLQHWGEINQVPVIAQHSGADSASVIFDAMQAATARNYDLLLADTAGRLHTQDHLMRELEKIKRVLAKINPEAPHETMLIIDASMGQNALNQAKQFHQAIGLSSITLTKLDGTAKGGIVFAICNELKLPIRFIGVGEQVDDLKPFQAQEFVDALFQ